MTIVEEVVMKAHKFDTADQPIQVGGSDPTAMASHDCKGFSS